MAEEWDEKNVEKYVYCDGELFPIKEMRGYGTREVIYEIVKDGYGNIIEKRVADLWMDPIVDNIEEWEAPNGCTIEADDNGDIPEEYIVWIKRENGKVKAWIPASLLDADEDRIYEAKSIEDIAEYIREVQEAWDKDNYEAVKLLRLSRPMEG